MKIEYIGHRRREIAAPGRSITVGPGDVVDVGEQLGRSLLAQARLFRAAPTVTSRTKPEATVAKEAASE